MTTQVINVKIPENNVYTSEELKSNINSILANPNDRTLWISGMPYGNRYFSTDENGILSTTPVNAEIFNDFENNIASADYSHAEGKSTQATNESEHACGKYNLSTLGKTIFSIGNGSEEQRKNIIEVTLDNKVFIDNIGKYNSSDSALDIAQVINTTLSKIGLSDSLEYTPEGIITATAKTLSEAIQLLDTKLSDVIENGTGSGDFASSQLPEDFTMSDLTNNDLLLVGGDSIVTAFGKLEKAIVDNEQVFTNATETMAISVGLDESLQYTSTGQITSGATSISEAINIIESKVSSISSGADYAEMFEWKDGNIDNEDRIGYFVELDSDKIIKCSSIKTCIGIVTGTASVISDNSFEWHNKYLKDKWGRYLTDNSGSLIVNPEYDPTKQYKQRYYRKEWSPIGLVGKLYVRQDGSLNVGCKCVPNKNGIGTLSKTEEGYYVMEVIDNETAKILFK